MPQLNTRFRRVAQVTDDVLFYGFDPNGQAGGSGNVGTRDQQITAALLKRLVSFAPVQVGSAVTVAGSSPQWQDTGLQIPSTADFGRVRCDLSECRGIYDVDWDQWRALPARAANTDVVANDRIPLSRAYSFAREVTFCIGRRAGDRLLVAFTAGASGVPAYEVRAYTL